MAVLEEYYDAVVSLCQTGIRNDCFYCECGKYSNDAVQSEYRRKL